MASFHDSLNEWQSTVLNCARTLSNQSKVRREYIRLTGELVEKALESVKGGASPVKVGKCVQEMRNQIMNMQRAKSTRLVKAFAQAMKKEGKPLAWLLDKYSGKGFGKAFKALTAAERDVVWLELIKAGGRTRPSVSAQVGNWAKSARALWILSLGISALHIGMADDKTHQTGKEIASLLASLGGGAGGAVAVGAMVSNPIGIAVGMVVGGMLGAALVGDLLYDAAVNPLGVGSQYSRAFLKPYVGRFTTNEKGIARALYKKCGRNAIRTFEVLDALFRHYNNDADEVALEYLKLVSNDIALLNSLKHCRPLGQLLVACLEDGWTTGTEATYAKFARKLWRIPKQRRRVQRGYSPGIRCCLPGTAISMADGSVRPIERIAVGDLVRALDGSGSVVAARVCATMSYLGSKQMVQLNDELTVTHNHRVLINQRWTHSALARPSDKLLGIRRGRYEVDEVAAFRVQKRDYWGSVFNFEVEDCHNYFADGVLVHNTKII